MAFGKVLVCALALVCTVQSQAPIRDGFKVTWALNPFAKNAFNSLPRTVTEAQSGGWQRQQTLADCTSRYLSPSGDNCLVLIYDNRGTIAGAKMRTLKGSSPNVYNYAKQPMFTVEVGTDGLEYYTTTAWFINPLDLCNSARNPAALNSEGTINGLWLQEGPTPSQSSKVGMTRAEVIPKGWSENKCFPGMGLHNFYETLKMQDNNCATFKPVFLLFNKERNLIGFGLATVGKAVSKDNRFEYPDSKAIKMIVGEDKVSDCLVKLGDTPGLTTMHFYFTQDNAYTCAFW